MSHPGWNEENRVIALTQDGRTIAKGYTKQVLAAGNHYVEVTIPNLRYVEEILQWNFRYDPLTSLLSSANQVTVMGNVVGVTLLALLAGTTLTVECIAIGV